MLGFVIHPDLLWLAVAFVTVMAACWPRRPNRQSPQAALAAGIAVCASVFCHAGSALSVPYQRLISP
jgi:hypothetical protein